MGDFQRPAAGRGQGAAGRQGGRGHSGERPTAAREQTLSAHAGTPPLPPGTVLGIAGSPRRQGNSDRLLDACLEGAAAAGSPVFKLRAKDYGIEPCRGCNSCSKTGECVVKDRMFEVYPLLDSAAALVVSTPVFFATVPAVLKALYDRCQPYWARRYVLHQPPRERRPAALLIVRGGGDPFGYECAVTPTRSVLNVVGFSLSEEPLVLEGVDSAADIDSRPGGLDAARQIGRGLAERVANT